MYKECLVCKKPFKVKPSHANKRVSCSSKCMAQMYAARLKGERNPHWKGGNVVKICGVCGNSYQATPGRAKNSKFCSYKCMGSARAKYPGGVAKTRQPIQRKQHFCKQCGIKIKANVIYCKHCSPKGKGRIITTCEMCGKSFAHFKVYKRRFCSQACSWKRYKADGNPNWKGGRESLSQRIRNCKKSRLLIASVLKRDKYTCRKCGQVGGDLEVDHISPFSEILEEFLQHYQVLSKPEFVYELSLIALKYKPFWDRKNLRTLCRKCNWDRQINGRRLIP